MNYHCERFRKLTFQETSTKFLFKTLLVISSSKRIFNFYHMQSDCMIKLDFLAEKKQWSYFPAVTWKLPATLFTLNEPWIRQASNGLSSPWLLKEKNRSKAKFNAIFSLPILHHIKFYNSCPSHGLMYWESKQVILMV